MLMREDANMESLPNKILGLQRFLNSEDYDHIAIAKEAESIAKLARKLNERKQEADDEWFERHFKQSTDMNGVDNG